MPDNNPKNIDASNPDDLVYVSAKNWARKKNIEDGNASMLESGGLGRPGILTGIIFSLIDSATTFIVKLVVFILQISTFAYDWMNNLIFGNFKGILPSSWTKGKVISLKWFRYTMTLLMPPFGVFLSKGIYGWFNIIICLILTYIHYLAGIIYAIVITVRNRYADQYEKREIAIAEADNPPGEAVEDIQAFIYMVAFFGILAGSIVFFLSIF
jgi:uncharacterized membrane protein YqaE (UPF0057 family)